MEISNNGVGVNGGIKLPIGYRFHPTDEELVVHYLRRKAFGVPLPAAVIPELDVLQVDPWNLPGDWKEKRYFFSRTWGSDSENRCKKAADSGYWKPTGKGRPIIASFANHIVGIRNTLLFREGKRSNQSKTQWIMHEYLLIGSATIHNTTAQACKVRLGEWVVYCVFQKKRRPKKQRSESKCSTRTSEVVNSSFIEFAMEESLINVDGAQPSSPCSSGITEVSSNGLDQEEISSSISFSSRSCERKTA